MDKGMGDEEGNIFGVVLFNFLRPGPGVGRDRGLRRGPDCDDTIATGGGCHGGCSTFYQDLDLDGRDGNYELYFARLSADGTKAGPDLRATRDAGYSFEPSLVWTGSEYGLAWEDNRDGNNEIYFTRLSSAGARPLRTSG
jgi:hypothetical protein